MNIVRSFNIPIILAIAGAISMSCVKDQGEINRVNFSTESQWGIPLVGLRLSANDAIAHFDNEGLVNTDPNGQVRLVYADTLEPLRADDFLSFPNQQFSASLQLTDEQFDDLQIQGTYAFSDVRTFGFDSPEGDRIDSIRFSEGMFRLFLGADPGMPLSGSVSILDPYTDVVMYSMDFGDQNPPVIVDLSAPLDGALLRFQNDVSTSNGIKIAYTLNFTYSASAINSVYQVDVQLLDFGLRSLGGYIVPRTFDLDFQELNLSLFDNTRGTQIRVEDPRINLNVLNGLGMGAALHIDRLFGSNKDGGFIEVPGSSIQQLSPLAPAPVPGGQTLTAYAINNGMMVPTVTDFLAVQPNRVGGDFSLTINPQNAPSVFISRDSGIDMSYEVEIPIFGSIANFSLVDTTAIGLGNLIDEVEGTAELSRLDLRIFINNGLPLDAALQLVFTDSLYNPIDSLFSTNLGQVLHSAPVNLGVGDQHPDYGRAVGISPTLLEFGIPRERALGLRDVSRLIVRVVGHTAGNGSHPIRIFESDAIDMNVAAKITLRIDV